MQLLAPAGPEGLTSSVQFIQLQHEHARVHMSLERRGPLQGYIGRCRTRFGVPRCLGESTATGWCSEGTLRPCVDVVGVVRRAVTLRTISLACEV